MQSQQKRLKWSRGETAEALEERTDTGITQASVELMENCIPDVYGNISRRPGLKIIPYGSGWASATYFGFSYDKYLQVIPFYLTETDYILIGVHFHSIPEFLRIKDGKVVSKYTLSVEGYPKTGVELSGLAGVYSYRPVSYTQQSNYMLIADGYNVWKLTVGGLNNSDDTFEMSCDVWKFTAGWYAPEGTRTKSVSSSDVAGLSFSASTIKNYIFTESSGETVVYSSITCGMADTGTATWTGATTTFYIHRVKASKFSVNTNSSSATESFTMTSGQTYTHGQTLKSWTYYVISGGDYLRRNGKIKLKFIGNKAQFVISSDAYGDPLDVSSYFTISASALAEAIPLGSIVQFPNNGGYMRVEGFDSDGVNQIMYGPLLTPVADDTATDTSVNVEYGFERLQPDDWNSTRTFPHPLKLVFVDQRLWAGSWANSLTDNYSITIGSQIAKYSDFKNDYNQENESITLDILTKFKEKIVHLVDYNGLKIMTDSYEYAVDEKLIKQSANGSFEYCEPIVFDSLCLYIDSTGCQVKAMQYEFQNNVFNSTTINQIAPKKLVWYPYSMAQYEDKYNDTGKYLFLVNREDGEARVAVCNFVPSNQANIWNRWKFPQTDLHTIPATTYAPMVHSIVNLKDGALFMLTLNSMVAGTAIGKRIVPARLDFNANTDLDSALVTDGTYNYFAPIYEAGNISNNALTMSDTEVAVYSDGEFKFNTTTGNFGQITADLTGLTNITLGLPINAKVVSHPIDVGGKTKSIKKRIAKTVLSVHGTEPGAITINGKTGYMNPQKDKINFYGVTGMKDEIKYTLTNNNGAMFHLESLLMNIEYGTLIS